MENFVLFSCEFRKKICNTSSVRMAVMDVRHMVMGVNYEVMLVLVAVFLSVCNILHLMHMFMMLVGMRVNMVVLNNFMFVKMLVRFSKQQKDSCHNERERDEKLHCRSIFTY